MREIVSEDEAVFSLICLCYNIIGHNEVVATGTNPPGIIREHYIEMRELIYGPLLEHQAIKWLTSRDEMPEVNDAEA